MNRENDQNRLRAGQIPTCCPNCEGSLKTEASGDWIRVFCASCGKELGTVAADQNLSDLLFSQYENAVLEACLKSGWDKNEARIEKTFAALRNYLGKYKNDPYFAMLNVARLTHGFKPSRYRKLLKQKTAALEADELNIEATCKICDRLEFRKKDYKNSFAIESLITRYKLMRQKNSTALFRATALVACIAISLLAAVFSALCFYEPVTAEPTSGITFRVDHDALPILDKFSVKPDVKQYDKGSAAYINAESALRNESETFVLYDLSLTDGALPLSFEGNVTVEIPIPTGFDTSCVKVYHVISDTEYEEMDATVSPSNNTVSFTTSHFSLYAVAERLPVVCFDTDGAGDIPRQIVKKAALVQRPADPVKDGYTFMGWINTDDGKAWDFLTQTVTHDLTLYADWRANQYTVTLDPAEGTLVSDRLTVTFDRAYPGLPVPVREGFIFLGWSLGGTVIGGDTVCSTAADHTLTAVWEHAVYTVSFDAAGGTMAETVLQVTYEGNYGELPVPEREGYTFAGWTRNGEPVIGASVCNVAANHTLTAAWTANTYTVSFDANGGMGATGILNVTYGSPYGDLPVPVREGYDLLFWRIEGTPIHNDTVCVTAGDHTLIAVWGANSYTVSFDTNGGENGLPAQSVRFGSAYGVLPVPVREGYTFSHWSLDGMTVGSTTLCTTVGAHTLVANWIPNKYAVTLDPVGGSLTEGAHTVVYDASYGTLPVPVRVGYLFKGWRLGSASVTSETVCKTARDHTLTAEWEAVRVTVILDPCEGMLPNSNDKVTAIFDSAYGTLPTPVREHYVFTGWYLNGTLVTGTAICQTATEHTLVATWREKTYTVTLDPNGLDTSLDSLTVIYKEAYGALPVLTRHGYTFEGWYLDDVRIADSTLVGLAEDHTLTAKWTLITYRVEYEFNGGVKQSGGSYPTSYTVEDIARVTDAVYPTYPAYNHFLGWFEDEACTKAFANDLEEKPRDVTLYAKWDLCYVYNTIDSSPWVVQNVAVSGVNYTRIIFDWSRENNTNLLSHTGRDTAGTGRYNNIDIHNGVTELIFIGGGKTFLNFRMYLCFFEQGDAITIRFDNFNFKTNEGTAIALFECGKLDLTLDTVGNCSIGTSVQSGDILALSGADLTVSGAGTLTLTAGDGKNGGTWGESGGNGGTAIKADSLTLELDGILYAFGGNGGDGHVGKNGDAGNPNYNADGSDRDSVGDGADGGDGGHGQDGGNGGSGGSPYNADIDLQLNRGELYAYGGDAGSGADGGDGGNGGRGQESGGWGCTGGDGGNAGSGGDGGDSGVPGKAVSGSLTETDGKLHSYNGDGGLAGSGGDAGSVGPAGTHSNIRDSKKYWATRGSAGSDGNPGTDGDDGTVFY